MGGSWDLQLEHGVSPGTPEGEAEEDEPRDEEDVAAAVDVAYAREEYGEACPGLVLVSSTTTWEVLLTHVREQIREDDPVHIRKLPKLLGDGDHGGRHDGGIEAREEEADENATPSARERRE